MTSACQVIAIDLIEYTLVSIGLTSGSRTNIWWYDIMTNIESENNIRGYD